MCVTIVIFDSPAIRIGILMNWLTPHCDKPIAPEPSYDRWPRWLSFLILVVLPGVGGCLSSSDQDQVVVYSALDREFSAPIFGAFEEQSGIRVLAKYDTESTKTVGLANQIMQAEKPAACDLFWNNEILHTLRLSRAGKLQPLPADLLAAYPEAFRSPKGHWVGLAARARVLVIHPEAFPPGEPRPSSMEELVDPKWKGRACIAKPLFGTTATHFAVLYQQWGEERFRSFVQQLVDNQVGILSGNRQVAADVAAGKYDFGFTDTDDFQVEYLSGGSLQIVWPDQAPDQPGALLLPNTLCLPKHGQHAMEAEKLLTFLLAGDVESRLASGPSVQLPLRTDLQNQSPDVFPDPRPRWQEVPWDETVEAWEKASGILKDAFY